MSFVKVRDKGREFVMGGHDFYFSKERIFKFPPCWHCLCPRPATLYQEMQLAEAEGTLFHCLSETWHTIGLFFNSVMEILAAVGTLDP